MDKTMFENSVKNSSLSFGNLNVFNLSDENDDVLTKIGVKYNIPIEELKAYKEKGNILLDGIAVMSDTQNGYIFDDLSETVKDLNCPMVIGHSENDPLRIAGRVLSIKSFNDHVEALALITNKAYMDNILSGTFNQWSISWYPTNLSELDEYDIAVCSECGKPVSVYYHCKDHPNADAKIVVPITIAHIAFVVRAGSEGSGVSNILNKQETAKNNEVSTDKNFKEGAESMNEELKKLLEESIASNVELREKDIKILELTKKIDEVTGEKEKVAKDLESLKVVNEESIKFLEESKAKVKALESELDGLKLSAEKSAKELSEIKDKIAKDELEAKTVKVEEILSMKEKLGESFDEDERELEKAYLSNLSNEVLDKKVSKLSKLVKDKDSKDDKIEDENAKHSLNDLGKKAYDTDGKTPSVGVLGSTFSFSA